MIHLRLFHGRAETSKSWSFLGRILGAHPLAGEWFLLFYISWLIDLLTRVDSCLLHLGKTAASNTKGFAPRPQRPRSPRRSRAGDAGDAGHRRKWQVMMIGDKRKYNVALITLKVSWPRSVPRTMSSVLRTVSGPVEDQEYLNL